MNDENSYKKCDKCGEFYDAHGAHMKYGIW